MALVANRRSVMTLFSEATSPSSHQARMVLAEKGITVEIVNVDLDNLPEDLIDLNPYQTVPTLVDRELVLYDARVIMEYLDERFPHPPLMPVDPVSRARARLAMFRIERDWYSLLDEIHTKGEKNAARSRKMLRDSLTSSVEVFAALPFFLSEEFGEKPGLMARIWNFLFLKHATCIDLNDRVRRTPAKMGRNMPLICGYRQFHLSSFMRI